MERCSTGTIYKIAKALNVTVESLLEPQEYEQTGETEHRSLRHLKVISVIE